MVTKIFYYSSGYIAIGVGNNNDIFKKTISVFVWFLIEEDVNLLMHIYLIILTGRLMNEFLQNGVFFPENRFLGKSLKIKKNEHRIFSKFCHLKPWPVKTGFQ